MSEAKTRAVGEGFISEHLNRRISVPIARALAPTPITPNQITVLSFGVGLLSAAAFAFGQNVAGGLMAQAASVLDGVDGDLARLQGRVSSFGGFLDAVLDRYADAAIITGMIFGASVSEFNSALWGVGLAALVGALMVSYTRARAESGAEVQFQGILSRCATRDVRLFILMLGGLVGQLFWTLVALAILTNVSVVWRVWLVSQTRR
jgi:phosphatidylglycerophosphate synthase